MPSLHLTTPLWLFVTIFFDTIKIWLSPLSKIKLFHLPSRLHAAQFSPSLTVPCQVKWNWPSSEFSQLFECLSVSLTWLYDPVCVSYSCLEYRRSSTNAVGKWQCQQQWGYMCRCVCVLKSVSGSYVSSRVHGTRKAGQAPGYQAISFPHHVLQWNSAQVQRDMVSERLSHSSVGDFKCPLKNIKLTLKPMMIVS